VRPIDRREVVRLAAIAIPSVGLATLAVALIEGLLEVDTASAVYLVAVVVTAIGAGTLGAVIASVASFLIYDWFFVAPYHTFTVSDPAEWLALVLLLFVGIVVGQLAAMQRARARAAEEREREARALFAVSRALVTRDSMRAGLAAVAEVLCHQLSLSRVWLTLGADDAGERTIADTREAAGPLVPVLVHVLQRSVPPGGEESFRWVRVHQPTTRRQPSSAQDVFRVRIEAGGTIHGSIYAAQDRGQGEPGTAETRLLASAADQVGQAVAHDRMAAEAQAAEIARQSDELKSALLQSVSHDLRTPLATIRAAAGTLRPGAGLSEEDREESVQAIDREVEYLNRLVTNLLDLSRIEAGVLRADLDVFDLDDLVGRSLERLAGRLAGRPLEVLLSAFPVVVDPTFLDECVTNIVENALKYAPPGASLRVAASEGPLPQRVRLTIEDGGPGAPDETLPRLFEKFYRVPGSGRGSRSGTGIGLAVVRGLVEAMGGEVHARRSSLGGLAVDLDLVQAQLPEHLLGSATA
jgi:two-component system, OmpR family, sensor histidine kinase KdpD